MSRLEVTGYFIDPVITRIVLLSVKLQVPLLLEGLASSGENQFRRLQRWKPSPNERRACSRNEVGLLCRLLRREYEMEWTSGSKTICQIRIPPGRACRSLTCLAPLLRFALRAKPHLPLHFVCLLISLLCAPVFAVNPHQRIDELYHSSWTAKDGLAGTVNALAQNTDGFLWVGTSDGPFRFDGVYFERYQPQSGSFPPSAVVSLMALPDGGLWTGYSRGGASLLQDGGLKNYSDFDGLPTGTVRCFARDLNGTVWAAVVGGLARLQGKHWRKIWKDWNYPRRSAWTVYVAWRPRKTFYRSYRMCRRLQAQRRVSSAPGWCRSHLFGRHCQLRPLRTREVTALEVESQINSRNSRRI
jgi:hypothetical protein